MNRRVKVSVRSSPGVMGRAAQHFLGEGRWFESIAAPMRASPSSTLRRYDSAARSSTLPNEGMPDAN